LSTLNLLGNLQRSTTLLTSFQGGNLEKRFWLRSMKKTESGHCCCHPGRREKIGSTWSMIYRNDFNSKIEMNSMLTLLWRNSRHSYLISTRQGSRGASGSIMGPLPRERSGIGKKNMGRRHSICWRWGPLQEKSKMKNLKISSIR
jgi:hypothetical protein